MRILDLHKLKENIARVAQYDLDERLTFGSAYAVFQNGQMLVHECFGTTAPNGGRAVRGDTIFRLASMTKPIVAMAALVLVDRGMLTLDTPVKAVLPQFEGIHIVTPAGEDLGVTPTDPTVLHMLTHTSGLGGLKPMRLTAADKATAEASVAYFIRQGLDHEPFKHQVYNAYVAFDVVGLIVKSLTGKSLEAFLQEELFAPCGMVDTTFMPNESQWERMIAMHTRVDGECRIGAMPAGCVFADFPASHQVGGAGLVSTLDDYARFAEMLLAEGRCAGGRIVSPETARLMRVSHVPYALMQRSEGWGLGVRVIDDERYRLLPVGCYGWSGAYGSHFWVDPENRITAVFMKNSQVEGGANNPSARRFEQAVYDALA